MAWNVPMIHALLLRTPAPKAAAPLRVSTASHPLRVSPAAIRHETVTGYQRKG
jgi:hypothetical protein